MMQNKLKPGKLLNDLGVLIESGYHTEHVKTYNRNAINAPKIRIKEWDYFYCQGPDFGLALTIADNGYLGLLSVSYIDFKTKHYVTKSHIIPMSLGKLNLPETPMLGRIDIHKKNTRFTFDYNGNSRHLYVKFPKFQNNLPIEIDVYLTEEPKESMVIVVPFKEKPTQFYYNQKIPGFKVNGQIIINNAVKRFDAKSLGLLDWGRGVWPYKNQWFWSMAQGYQNGKHIAFNLGYGFGDNSTATENMIFYDGKAHKTNDITFHIKEDDKGNKRYLEPWQFTSSDQRIELTMTPLIDRKDMISVGVLQSKQHQVFGLFNGQIVLDNNKTIIIKDMMGFAEDIQNKW